MVRVSQQRAELGEGFNRFPARMCALDPTRMAATAAVGHSTWRRGCAPVWGACIRGLFCRAQAQDKLMPLHTALFIETNPAPAKYALSVLGRCAETVRLPMVVVAEKTKAAVRAAMVHAGLIN